MVSMVKGFVLFLLIVMHVGCDTVPDVKTYFTPGPDCETHIINEINRARNTVDIAVYSITNRPISDAIISAHNRGVRVRIITDRAQSHVRGASIPEFRRAGIPTITNKSHKIMHHKFAIFDGRRVMSGSYNWTENASHRNAENCDFFAIPNNKYPNRFEYLWDFYRKD